MALTETTPPEENETLPVICVAKLLLATAAWR